VSAENGKPGLGWLIEHGKAGHYFCKNPHPCWEKDASKALRFASKVDADTYIYQHGMTRCAATEHEWVTP
jgi:hypothetical protein